ncbi:MAG: DUF932 domain-containing protein [candidate division Zixibacteria bacterium]|nr:DUF932 domain-containing protein [candidate division Zixibacteria bacterium]
MAKATRHTFKGQTSVEAVLEKADLNWTAEPQPLITGAGISVESHKAIVRDDSNSIIGIVGKGYEPIQNSHAFSFMDTICEKFGAQYEYCYSIDNGSKMIMQAKMTEKFEVRPGDVIQQYITGINSFNGTTPLRAYFTPIRMFCDNQCRASLRAATEAVSIRHTKNALSYVEEAFRVFGMGVEYFEAFQEQAQHLAQKAVDGKMVDKFLRECMGEPDSTRRQNQFDEVTALFEHGKGNNGSSAWDLYNGITEYVDHHRGKNADSRLASAMTGQGSTLKAKAFSVAMAL